MSAFSNTGAHDKTADPYKAANLENDVSVKDKVNDFGEFLDSCSFAIMTTRDPDSGALFSRCMAVAAKENGGIDLLFYTNNESGKTREIKSDPNTNISFVDSSGQWASISGNSTIVNDRNIIKKYYSRTLKAWMGDLGDGVHDGGPDDPRIVIIRVVSNTIIYAITNKNALTRGIEVAQGAITGKAPAIHKLREINEVEVRTWRFSKQVID
ncbi:Protein bli-3 [Golovinomyces cichoracearum]|uniref:Protein bli-3 n=1 Tax=Golovinomyces cichoracearum TaxID=62708 RepID=A0A420J2W1_9PEZI|nr:Protein bli-3 [Golovinomyces cichoracearum]